MIAYFDSSSIVKWFFDEGFSELARGTRDQAEIVVSSLVAFPEVLSAFNRAQGEGRCSMTEMQLVRDEFLRIWPSFQWINLNEELVLQAGQLIFRHNLRGFDAVHLASALLLKQDDRETEVFFSCFDHHLNRAARDQGLFTHDL